MCYTVDTFHSSSKKQTFLRPNFRDMLNIIRKCTPRENSNALFALGFVTLGCATVIAIWATIGLYFTRHYFVAHFLFCLTTPFAFYAMGGVNCVFKLGWVFTASFHYGYELWEDLLKRPLGSAPDWDQVFTGTLGLIAALLVYQRWNRYLDSKPIKDSPSELIIDN